MTDGSERDLIKKMNDQIILGNLKGIALREKAFTWFFEAMDENKTGEKEDWCRTVKESISRLYSSDNDVDFNIHLLHELFSLGRNFSNFFEKSLVGNLG